MKRIVLIILVLGMLLLLSIGRPTVATVVPGQSSTEDLTSNYKVMINPSQGEIAEVKANSPGWLEIVSAYGCLDNGPDQCSPINTVNLTTSSQILKSGRTWNKEGQLFLIFEGQPSFQVSFDEGYCLEDLSIGLAWVSFWQRVTLIVCE